MLIVWNPDWPWYSGWRRLCTCCGESVAPRPPTRSRPRPAKITSIIENTVSPGYWKCNLPMARSVLPWLVGRSIRLKFQKKKTKSYTLLQALVKTCFKARSNLYRFICPLPRWALLRVLDLYSFYNSLFKQCKGEASKVKKKRKELRLQQHFLLLELPPPPQKSYKIPKEIRLFTSNCS